MLLKVDKKSNISSLLGKLELYLQDIQINKKISMEIKTIVSEIVYNIYKYSPHGNVRLSISGNTLYIKAVDHGLGIDDINQAIQDGYSTSGTLGSGFASIFRLSDEIDIQTSQSGTIINIKKMLI